jgi:hypothetical protein
VIGEGRRKTNVHSTSDLSNRRSSIRAGVLSYSSSFSCER